MISTKSFYRNVDCSVGIQFPKEPEAVESFFEKNRLLLNFSDGQVESIAVSLAGTSKDLAGIAAVVERSLQKQVKDSGNYRLFCEQKRQADFTLKSMNAVALSVSNQTGCATVSLSDLIP